VSTCPYDDIPITDPRPAWLRPRNGSTVCVSGMPADLVSHEDPRLLEALKLRNPQLVEPWIHYGDRKLRWEDNSYTWSLGISWKNTAYKPESV
jgi:hypothetical protein